MLKNFLKKLFIITLELVLISGALWYVAEKKGIKSVSEIGSRLERLATQAVDKTTSQGQYQVFPGLSDPVSRNFSWEYAGVKYSLTETLYKSVYQYYKSQPKTFSYSGELPKNWENDYYGMFLKSNDSDKSVATLANDLQALGKKHNLSNDQIVDLTLAFMQSIEYDDAKAKDILAKTDGVAMLHPYELLYEQKGVCSDKSLLTVALLRQMGYGTALFAYEQDNHMAVGIQCPNQYSTYGSGYCYAETTSVGNKIGIIPDFDSASNKTVATRELASNDFSQIQQTNLRQLGQVTIYQKTSGSIYSGIIQTQKVANEIDSLKKSIDSMQSDLTKQKKTIQSEEEQLKTMRNNLDAQKNSQNIEKYNSMVGKYNNLLEDYKNDVKKFNNSVRLYNNSIQRYNILIKQ